jgi:hypothetical protein
MVRSNTNEWTLLKDQVAFLRQDEPEESIEAFCIRNYQATRVTRIYE